MSIRRERWVWPALAMLVACATGSGVPTGAGGSGGSSDGGDSEAVCGDGIVDDAAGERCDGTCPTSCDDRDACTIDGSEGSADTCDLTCTYELVTECIADGCCASGCDGTVDVDCAVCGNDIVEVGELCDGSCPYFCPSNACNPSTLLGSPDTCDAECTGAPVTTCAHGDGCCAPGCAISADDDCATSVLIVHSTSTGEAADVQQYLAATSAFVAVDVYDLSGGTPTLGALTPYEALLVFFSFQVDTTALGNVLADYDAAGGRVVLAPMANVDTNANPGGLGGDFESGGYMLIHAGTTSAGNNNLVADLPSHPLLAGVTTLTAQAAYRGGGAAAAGATVVASWSTGEPLVVTAFVGWHERVDVNFYPPSSAVSSAYWTGDGAQLLANALLYH